MLLLWELSLDKKILLFETVVDILLTHFKQAIQNAVLTHRPFSDLLPGKFTIKYEKKY